MGVLTMSKNLFAWASIGENGKGTGGKKGDQTGKEVRVGAYYNFGQDKVIRFKNVLKGRKMAKVAKLIATDDSCGYSMTLGERDTLFIVCKGYNWDFEKIKKAIEKGTFPKCNTDCSSFYAACVNVTYGKQILSADSTTRNLLSRCTRTNKNRFKLINGIPSKFHKGDAPIKEGKHIIINV